MQKPAPRRIIIGPHDNEQDLGCGARQHGGGEQRFRIVERRPRGDLGSAARGDDSNAFPVAERVRRTPPGRHRPYEAGGSRRNDFLQVVGQCSLGQCFHRAAKVGEAGIGRVEPCKHGQRAARQISQDSAICSVLRAGIRAPRRRCAKPDGGALARIILDKPGLFEPREPGPRKRGARGLERFFNTGRRLGSAMAVLLLASEFDDDVCFVQLRPVGNMPSLFMIRVRESAPKGARLTHSKLPGRFASQALGRVKFHGSFVPIWDGIADSDAALR